MAAPALTATPIVGTFGMLLSLQWGQSVTVDFSKVTLVTPAGNVSVIFSAQSGGNTVGHISRTVYRGEAVTLTLAQGAAVNGGGEQSAAASGVAVTNSSTAGPPDTGLRRRVGGEAVQRRRAGGVEAMRRFVGRDTEARRRAN